MQPSVKAHCIKQIKSLLCWLKQEVEELELCLFCLLNSKCLEHKEHKMKMKTSALKFHWIPQEVQMNNQIAENSQVSFSSITGR